MTSFRLPGIGPTGPPGPPPPGGPNAPGPPGGPKPKFGSGNAKSAPLSFSHCPCCFGSSTATTSASAFLRCSGGAKNGGFCSISLRSLSRCASLSLSCLPISSRNSEPTPPRCNWSSENRLACDLSRILASCSSACLVIPSI
ncbi:MAG: hypothetical protein FJ302_13080 [Planctomycetes bacterium]|nr:hypothetical protein [Planctomycetota bacterium]